MAYGIMWLEIALAVFILITVILSAKDLVMLAYEVITTEASASYELLQGFLSYLLLLVVGLELALMLIKHTPGNVLEVMLYAVARKMLIASTNVVDLLIGVIAIGIIFAIDKFLHTKNEDKVIK